MKYEPFNSFGIKFSDRLREALHMRQMKQSQLSSLTGIPRSAITQYLQGLYMAKQDNIYRLSKALNVAEGWLMGFSDDVSRISDVLRRVDIDPDEIAEFKIFENIEEKGEALDFSIDESIKIRKPEEIAGVGDGEKLLNSVHGEELKIYNFFSSGSGSVNWDDYMMDWYVLEHELIENISKNGYVFEVHDKNMEPFFLAGDRIIFIRKELTNWEDFDSKLILLNLDGKPYIKKLFFRDGIPYLHTFNTRIYPPKRKDDFDSAELLGVFSIKFGKKDFSSFVFSVD